MSEHPILGLVALGYAPVIDAQRMVTATRLSILPLRPDASLDGAALLAALQPAFGEPPRPVQLNLMSETGLHGLATQRLPAQAQLEWPAFMGTSPEAAEAIQAARQNGTGLLLKGLSNNPLPQELRGAFGRVQLDLDDARRLGLAALQGKNVLVGNARGAAEIDEAFKLGAALVTGSPAVEAYEPPPGAGKPEIAADLQVIVELMSRLDQGDDVERLEQTLKRDPSLAFKLLRYMNSAAFGLPVEVSSFRHAIMLLGYARLKRWLALLLATASKDHTMRPIMYAALRRGLLMEELAKGMNESEMRDEMFICGLFSLLDHMLKQPFDKLLQSIPVPERVRQALVDQTGPCKPYLDLVHAIENESVFDFRASTEALMLGAEEVNLAVARALGKAAQLE
ncbi:HDOD domain-containing protein [Pelomonas sp. APW6]|uniref:HDOD domain-containing protein n=1 Tax=Roseateles subflavus TaxID=3053353 RepID=A0ABT7LMC5_9BURK|nr:HDOD domain-containing protein [Pelomonas sp. APW6]MDL5033624.1 HDOD domain-containing protein [Pelomonas sp. APW6]